jgi:hypothetical protein
VVPEIEQIPPVLVTANVTAPFPEPPVVDRATVGSSGDGAYVTEFTAEDAVRDDWAALLIVKLAAV